jgi:protein-tyrosine phosphatase
MANVWRNFHLYWGICELAGIATGQSLGIASVPNLRDVGGYKTRDGAVVRRGLAYRSNELNPISPGDMKKAAELGLINDFDLRTAEERKVRPDELPPGVKNVWLNVLADAKESGAARLEMLLHNPKEANVALGYAKFFSRSRDAVIRVCDEAGNVIETHDHAGKFKEW